MGDVWRGRLTKGLIVSKRLLALACAVFVTFSATAVAASSRGDGSKPASAAVTKLVTGVPLTTLNAVGLGKEWNQFTVKKLHGAQLKAKGVPEVLVGTLAWCPHCAVTNYALAIALSRFGKLRGLRVIDTGPLFKSEPHVKGISFYKTRYASPALSFRDVIIQNNRGKTFEKLTKAERKVFKASDRQGIFPAIDIGGAYAFINSAFDPNVIAHKSARQIAQSLADPTSPIAIDIDGFANLLTAAMCTQTGQVPTAVCTSPGVAAAAMKLPPAT